MAPTYPRPFGAPAPRRPLGPAAPAADADAARIPVPMRRYDILYLDADGQIEEAHRIAPANPAFEATCGAFAHGTLVQTETGDVPVEDLLPGQLILTRDSGPQPLLWVGSMTLVPNTGDPRIAPARLIRITENSIGLGRPSRDLVLGPHARLLRRNAACMSLFGTEAAFAPATAFTDGVSIIEISPLSSVRVYHLMLEGQHVITAGNVEVESYHPGRRDALGLAGPAMQAFLELFPGRADLSDFGQMRVPRLSHDDLRALES